MIKYLVKGVVYDRQMIGRRTDKLTERFVGPYRVKGIVSSNAIELDLPSSVRIHPVVNVDTGIR